MNETRVWHGRWIHGNTDPAPYLRKSFRLDAVPGKAVIHLCGLGWHELYVNGVKADDRVLAPCISQYDKRVFYLSYDVSGLLKAGANAIVVLLGCGLFRDLTPNAWNFEKAYWLGVPRLLCDFECDGKIILSSDLSWKIVPSPIVFNQLRTGERYDARLEVPGVLDADFDDAAFSPAKAAYPPPGLPVKEEMEPCRVCAQIEGEIRYLSRNAWIADFHVNLTGWCEIEVEGAAGATVTLEYAERLLDDGNITTENISEHIEPGYRKAHGFQRDCYTLKGGGREVWHPRFVYHGFQYCRITLRGDVKLYRATAHFIHNDFTQVGSFECSDALLNRIQRMTMQSYLANYTGIPTDCPHREKNGWTGDAQLIMETGLWNYSCAAAATSFLQTLADAQYPSGQLPGIAPTAGWGYCGNGPAWDLCLFEIPYRIWLFTGDDAPLQLARPYMERYFSFCRTMTNEDGLLDFGLGDWGAWVPDDAPIPQEWIASSCYAYAAKIYSRFDPEYAEIADRIKAALHRKYYRGNGIYADGQRTVLAGALYFGIAAEPEKTAARLAEAVRAKRHVTGFGILGSKYVFRMLAQYGYAEDAVKILQQTEFPSFGYWVEKYHATTLFENWLGTSSRNHIMFGDVSAWFYQYLAGITPLEDAPGFRHFEIRPCLVSTIDGVKAEHRSPYGLIKVEWRRENGHVRLTGEVPAGSCADVIVNGRTASGVSGSFAMEF